MEQKFNNQDCRNYAAVDVVKGICHATKGYVFADGDTCELFEKLPKCKHCQNYTPSQEEFIGICACSAPSQMTYPDLIAVTCEHFAWKQA